MEPFYNQTRDRDKIFRRRFASGNMYSLGFGGRGFESSYDLKFASNWNDLEHDLSRQTNMYQKAGNIR